MKDRKIPGVTLLLTLVMGMLVVQTALCNVMQPPPRPPFEWEFDLENLRIWLPYYLITKTIIATLNSVLLLCLFIIYLNIYRRTSTKFSMGLVIFSLALLLYTLSSNPLIYLVVGFRVFGFGPLLMIPDLFTTIASAILLYLSRQ